MNTINYLINKAKNDLLNCKESTRIDNLIVAKTLYTMKDSDKVFTDMNFCLVLLENGYGFSYFQGEVDYSLSRFVNKDSLEVVEQETPIYLRVAILDALFCLLNRNTFESPSFFTGSIREKAKQRATELLKHVPDRSKVLLLGAATEIIEEATKKKCNIKILDLEKQKIGLNLSSIEIEDGNHSDFESEIQNTEYVIATGMIFVSEYIDRILDLTRKHGKHLSLFMETGSNFGPQLITRGVDRVLSESFPFYDFYGDTKYYIYQTNKK